MKTTFFLIVISVCVSTAISAQNTIGVTYYTPEEVIDGYTLFTPIAGTNTYLIDACGREVNRWESNRVAGASVYLLESGKLLRTEEDTAAMMLVHGGGGGLVRLYDWNSNVEWSYQYSNSSVRAHHDVEYLPNGNVLILAWELKTIEEAIAAGRNPEYFSDVAQTLWPEHLVEVNPANDSIVWEWHLWDHLVQDFDPDKENFGVVAEHPELVDLNAVSSTPDFVHINSVDYNPELDQIILSAHAYSEIWIIDHSTTTAEAASHSGGNSGKGGDILYRWGNPAMYGAGDSTDRMLFKQHDAQWITEGVDAGKILVFNNGAGRSCPPPCAGYSSVDIIEPPVDSNGNYDNSVLPFLPTDYDWHYVKPDSLSFYSSFISGAQRLPNEHTLICSGAQKTFFEVDENNQIVWEYVNPMFGNIPLSQGDSPASANVVFRAYRYGSDYPGLQGQDLTPGNYLELNPDSSHCPVTNSLHEFMETSSEFTIFPNPVKELLKVTSNSGEIRSLSLYDIWGKRMYAPRRSFSNSTELDLSGVPDGVYLLHIETEKDSGVERLIKQ